ncbi:MAG: O-antigen ligase family protein [Rhodoglobus sp.]
MLESRWFRVGYPTLVFFTLLAGDAWRYTIGWFGWAALVLVLAGFGVALLVRNRARWAFGRLPYPLLAFLALTLLSTIWSFYPGFTLLGTAALWVTAIGGLGLAVAFSWRELLSSLGIAIRFILGLSFLFELYVSLIHRGPILPLVPEPGIDYSTLDKVPQMLYWSRDQLFDVLHGGKIQGIVGNSVLLSMVALVGLIVFALQLAGRTTKRRWSLPWLVVAAVALAFSRSATIIAALVVVVVVGIAALLVRRAQAPRARTITYASIIGLAAVGAVATFILQKQVLAILGKSEDLTGRLDIWATVIHLAQQRPIVGWGWISQWVPWVAPFDHLVFRNGVRQLHAHNSWIDMWFQLGIIGLIIFGALVLSTLWRSWALAVDRPQTAPKKLLPYTVEALLPLLVLTALIVQSLAESKLLVEFGMLFLIIVAVKTKGDRTDLKT